MGEVSLSELSLTCHRLKGLQECRNLIGKYAYYMAGYQHEACLELWAERDDALLEMPWGIYDGIEGIRRYLMVELGDRSDPKVLDSIRGFVTVQDIDNEVLEIAGDGLTARGCWTSPGYRTLNGGQIRSMWSWCKLAADFIFENGAWKLWRMQVYNLYYTDYKQSWSDCPLQDFDAIAEKSLIDRPYTETPWQFTMPYPTYQPEPPVPYGTYADVGLRFSSLPEEGGVSHA